MVSEGRLAGVVQGRQDKAVFVPDIYTRTQLAWIESFYDQNGYIGQWLDASLPALAVCLEV